MSKLAILLACFCAAAFVEGQEMPPPPPPGPPMEKILAPIKAALARVTRQIPQASPMQGMQDSMGGNPGNLAMQGLGNIPDPTAIIAKAQEVGRQFMNGRRRRQAGQRQGRGPPCAPQGPPPPRSTTSASM